MAVSVHKSFFIRPKTSSVYSGFFRAMTSFAPIDGIACKIVIKSKIPAFSQLLKVFFFIRHILHLLLQIFLISEFFLTCRQQLYRLIGLTTICRIWTIIVIKYSSFYVFRIQRLGWNLIINAKHSQRLPICKRIPDDTQLNTIRRFQQKCLTHNPSAVPTVF